MNKYSTNWIVPGSATALNLFKWGIFYDTFRAFYLCTFSYCTHPMRMQATVTRVTYCFLICPLFWFDTLIKWNRIRGRRETTCNIECMSLLPLKVTISINYHKCSVAAVVAVDFSVVFFMNSTIPLDIDKSLKEIVIMANDNDMDSMLIHINES